MSDRPGPELSLVAKFLKNVDKVNRNVSQQMLAVAASRQVPAWLPPQRSSHDGAVAGMLAHPTFDSEKHFARVLPTRYYCSSGRMLGKQNYSPASASVGLNNFKTEKLNYSLSLIRKDCLAKH